MKTCPKCHIKVGGDAEYCPLCQCPLNGEDEAPLWPKTVPAAWRLALFYKIVAFVLLAGVVVCVTIDFQTEGTLHWSYLVALCVLVFLTLLRSWLRHFQSMPRLLFQVLVAVSAVAWLCDWYVHGGGFAVDYVIPILCTVTLVLNFVLAFIPGRMAENGLVYLLMNIGVGVVPYLLLFLRPDGYPLPWLVCLVVSVVTFLGLVVFRGRILLAELEKRLHL